MGHARAGRAGRPGHEQHGDRPRPPRGAARCSRDWTDRIAAGDVPPAPPRPQGRRAQSRADDVGLGRSGDVRARRADHRQAQPDGERLRSDLRRRLGERRLPDRRPARAHGGGAADSRCSIRNVRPARRRGCPCRRRTGATGCTGTTRRLPTTPPWTARGACGCRRGSASPRTSRRSARRTRRRRWRRRRRSFRQVQYFDPRTAPVQAGQHLLRHASRAVRRRQGRDVVRQRRRSAAPSAGSIRGSSTRPATRRRRRAGAAATTTSNQDGQGRSRGRSPDRR